MSYKNSIIVLMFKMIIENERRSLENETGISVDNFKEPGNFSYTIKGRYYILRNVIKSSAFDSNRVNFDLIIFEKLKPIIAQIFKPGFEKDFEKKKEDFKKYYGIEFRDKNDALKFFTSCQDTLLRLKDKYENLEKILGEDPYAFFQKLKDKI